MGRAAGTICRSKKAKIYFTAGERTGGSLLLALLQCNLDGSDLKLLTPEYAHHTVTFSPEYKYFVIVTLRQLHHLSRYYATWTETN
jgi:hypothetical protein